MMAGLLAPSAGQVAILGSPPGAARDLPLGRARAGARGRPSVPDGLPVRAVQRPAPGPRGPGGAAERAIATVELTDAAHRSIGTYSKGMRQRAKLAGALVHDPRSCCSTSRSTAWTRASGCT
jgi:ABC-2 type transport system ATP-binding protein